MNDSDSRLITGFYIFCREFINDHLNGYRNILAKLTYPWKLLSDMCMDQLQRVFRFERLLVGQHLEKGNSQSVEICSVICSTIHSPGLLRRNIGKGSFQFIADVGV